MQNKTKKRFYEYGFKVGLLPSGSKHSLADVPGVRVGHCTKIEGSDLRTGCTVIDPGIKSLFQKKVPAAVVVGNGFGKLVGSTQVDELGTLEAPLTLTNTLAVGPVLRGIVELVLTTDKIKNGESINAVVGETNDGYLNDLHSDSVRKEDVRAAWEARSAEVGVGNVGAGTGTRAFSWKGGIGTASRKIKINQNSYILGALVQTNFGGSLSIIGAPVGQALGKTDFDIPPPLTDGSCMIVLATNAPVSARQLKRIARRAFLALGKTGSVMSHGSGEYAIALSTNRAGLEGAEESGRCLADNDLTPAFLATVEATEESIYDALFAAETLRGRAGHVLEALPLERVLPLLEKARKL